MRTFGQDLPAFLARHGITHAFGIPGVHTVELYRGLPGSGIVHVTPRHEQGAGFMAYGYGFATGRPAACFLITGPGLANAATAIAEARSESIPVLVIATNNGRRHLGLDAGRLHETKSQMAIGAQLADVAHQLLDQANLPSVLGRAFSRFKAGRPTPAYLEIPLDLLTEPSTFDKTPWPPATPPSPDAAAVALAADRLTEAGRPIVLLGGGAVDAAKEALALVERLDCPVVTTTAGKGVVSEDHPLSLGASLPFRPVQDYLKGADVVLAVGSELAETDTLYTYTEYELGDGLIRIDIDLDQLSRNYRPRLAILSDAGRALSALDAALAAHPRPPRQTPGAQIAAGLRSRLTDQWLPGADAHKRVLDILRDVLADDAIVVSEECQLGYTANQYFRCRRPRTYLHPSGYGTLGPGVPAAAGAKIGCPDRQVVAIVGDGGFLFTAGELAAAVEQRLALPIVMWNSGGYREIANYMDRHQIERIGVDLKTPDFVALARSFGAIGLRPEGPEAFKKVLVEALTAPVPTLIELSDDAAWLA